MNIRNEASQDWDAIRRLLIDAFGGEGEAKLVEALRNDGDLAIALVADEGTGVVGFAALSPLKSPPSAMALAPVAVVPDRQRQGIGTLLIVDALRRARAANCAMVFVLGDANYYGRFGFAPEAARGFASKYAGPHFMALKLTEEPTTPAPVIYSDRFDELA